MEPRNYLALLRRAWFLISACALIGGSVAAGVSLATTPVYSATSAVYFSLNSASSANDLYQGSNYTQSQMESFAVLAQSPVVLNPVIRDLNIDETVDRLSTSIHVVSPQGTVILRITATDPSAALSAEIANQVAKKLGAEVERSAPKNELGDSNVSTRIIASAQPSTQPSSPNTRLYLVAGFVLGLVMGVAAALLRGFFNARIIDGATLANTTSLPVLGSIEQDDLLDFGDVASSEYRNAPPADDFRQLRVNLHFACLGSRRNSVLVTSSMRGEGKSVIASNLAMAIAEAEEKVILVDADLRQPAIARYFGVETQGRGLSTLIDGGATVDDVIRPSGLPNLDILPSGPVPTNPAAILSSRLLAETLENLKTRYDVVIIDSAPALTIADTSVMALSVDGVLVIVDSTKSRKQQLSEAIDNLNSSGAVILGLVLNRLPKVKGRKAYYATPRNREERAEVG